MPTLKEKLEMAKMEEERRNAPHPIKPMEPVIEEEKPKKKPAAKKPAAKKKTTTKAK